MTEVHFYTGLPDKTAFACELVRRAFDRGRKAVVVADEPGLLSRFDAALWSFDPVSFVPHVRASDPLAERTPVILADAEDADSTEPRVPHHELLFNLGTATPKFFARFDMLIELVGTDDADRAAGRERWKFYAERGYPLTHRPRDP